MKKPQLPLRENQVDTGSVKERKEDYDLMSAVMICLGNEKEDADTNVLRLLNILLSTETDSGVKCQILEEDFNIKMTQTLESEVSLMCNLSKGVEEKGIQKGIQQGMDKGKIYGAIAAYKDVEFTENMIIKKLQEKFQLTEEAAKIYLEEF